MTRVTFFLLVLFFSVSLQGFAEIRVGDTLQIIIKGVPADEKPRIDGKYVVGGAGTIRLPILDADHPAAGKTGEKLARSIERAYREAEVYTSPTIEVITNDVAPPAAAMVSVGGEVKRPGPVPFRPGMTIVQLIQAAGDMTIYGTKKRVYVTRGRKTFELDLRKDAHRHFEMMGDDTVVVDHKGPFDGE